MNRPFLLSTLAGITAGAAVFLWQSLALSELPGVAPRPAASGPGQATTPQSANRIWDPPPVPTRPAPVGKLLDRLSSRIVELLSEGQIADILEPVDAAEGGWIALSAGLAGTERDALQNRLAAFRREKAAALKQKKTPAEMEAVDARKQTWLREFLGPERMAKVEESRRLSATAAAETDAARLVSRISDAADLTTEQKDRLYAGLIERSREVAAAPAAPQGEMEFRLYGDVKEEPAPPSLAEEAKAILTPDQWAVFDQNSSLNVKQQQAMVGAMQKMVLGLIPVLQEVLDETAPPAEPAKDGDHR